MNEFPMRSGREIADHLLSNSLYWIMLTCDVLMAGMADGMNTENAFYLLMAIADKPRAL